MSRPTEWGGYLRVLREILDRVKDPGIEIHLAGIADIGGVGDQFRYLEYLETGDGRGGVDSSTDGGDVSMPRIIYPQHR